MTVVPNERVVVISHWRVEDRDGHVRLSIVGDDTNKWVWSWPRRAGPESYMSLGEELATALSLIDGTFSVVRHG